MGETLKYSSIAKEDWTNPNISVEKRKLMIDYIRNADKNDIELTVDQIDFKLTLLGPEAVEEISKNYGYPIEK